MYQEENNLLKTQNEDLCSKLHRTEAALSCVKEELNHLRAANDRNAVMHFEKEMQLHEKSRLAELMPQLQSSAKSLQADGSRRLSAPPNRVFHNPCFSTLDR